MSNIRPIIDGALPRPNRRAKFVKQKKATAAYIAHPIRAADQLGLTI
ncbi:hypothetical protein SAMN04488003_1082 [Loktanella fryxellensis]|uniref:Uncharacterized protein n=1 Tax=Loktanella fryxellensis TaxID=245187 RepID=A0A1H8D6A7_9RHOB|nr:hypothetical protein SAMN04488003_1082 [Loktanella fryxellensis]